MIWVVGGGFNVGTPHDKQFDGSHYAEEEDVVIVRPFQAIICVDQKSESAVGDH
jgi:hypothetical protein